MEPPGADTTDRGRGGQERQGPPERDLETTETTQPNQVPPEPTNIRDRRATRKVRTPTERPTPKRTGNKVTKNKKNQANRPQSGDTGAFNKITKYFTSEKKEPIQQHGPQKGKVNGGGEGAVTK